jgi:glycosyltransferase involved in cell wall biosynthesis
MTRILAIATNPASAASTRFRVMQWMPELERAGFALTLDAFFSPRGAEVLYGPGRRPAKSARLVAGAIHRAAVLLRAARTADMLFIHREAFPLGRRVLFERIETFPGAVIYDYDDAMFLPQRQGRGLVRRLENLRTPLDLMQRSDLVLAGNRMLTDFARQHARQVLHLPTCVDTERFRSRVPHDPRSLLRVGWIGSHTTAKYLQTLLPVLHDVSAEHAFELYVVGAGWPLSGDGLRITQISWALEREIDDFAGCDVGLYPLWDDPWTRGKCGFKAIQFMACGVPVLAAAVGANRDIIEDGVNGFLASTDEEWTEKLGWLLTDRALRDKLGQAGRRTVEERYSVRANAPALIDALQSLRARRGGA